MDLIDLLSRADEWRVDGRFPRATELTFKSTPTVNVAYQRAHKMGLLLRQAHGQYELTKAGREKIHEWRILINPKKHHEDDNHHTDDRVAGASPGVHLGGQADPAGPASDCD